MPDFTTYNYIGNSSAPVRRGALAPRPGRVVESGYITVVESDLGALSNAGLFSFCLPPSGRVVESGFLSPQSDAPEFNLFPSSQRAFDQPVNGRIVESGYDAYNAEVQNGGMPDPDNPPDSVEISDWGSLADSTVEDDWGSLDTAEIELEYGALS